MKVKSVLVAGFILALAMNLSAYADANSGDQTAVSDAMACQSVIKNIKGSDIAYPIPIPGPEPVTPKDFYLAHSVNNVGSPVTFILSDEPRAKYSIYFGDGTMETGVLPASGYVKVTHAYKDADYKGYFVTADVSYHDNTVWATKRNVPVWIAGDANGDGAVNVLDATIVGQHMNSKNGEKIYDDGADLNNDDVVNEDDLKIVEENRLNPMPAINTTITLPDLKIESIAHLRNGNMVTWVVNYRNTGDAPIADKFSISLEHVGERHGVIMDEVTPLSKEDYFLEPGEVGSAIVNVRYDAPGSYTVKFTVDRKNEIKELDESNNEMLQTIVTDQYYTIGL